MNRLAAFVRTRRKLVFALWVGLLVVSVPFASQQTKHLTSGGFEVPGSGSDEVDKQISRFAGQTTEQLGIVLEPKGGDLVAAVDRVGAAARETDHVELAPEVAAQTKEAAARPQVLVVPLIVDGTVDEILQASKDLREALHVDEVDEGVQAYVVGQQALWAGMHEVQQEDLEKAEMTGFPAILIVLLAVFGSVLAALLPAGLAVAAVVVTGVTVLISLLGRRADERGRIVSFTGALYRRVRPEREKPPGTPTFWERWTSAVMKRSALSAALASLVLLALAIPALSLDFGNGALRQFPEGHETRRGAELAAAQTVPGEAAPLLIVVDADGPISGGQTQLEAYAGALEDTPGVSRVEGPILSDDGEAALIKVVAAEDPEAESTLGLVERLRVEGGRASGAAELGTVLVGGYSAQQGDFTGLIAGSIWKLFLFVTVCSYLVLLVVVRSVLLPLKAVLMNMLTIGAAYGVLVMFFQYGWFDWTGFEHLGYVNVVTPPLLLAIVCGLSMDYEVFLLSRIRERYLATGDNRRAVAEGLQSSAKVISSAAIIMVVVFAIFATTGVPQIKEIGVGLSVAIALDATLVRLVLVPATMELMGKWNWWLPGWLDRILPNADFESDTSPKRRTAHPSRSVEKGIARWK